MIANRKIDLCNGLELYIGLLRAVFSRHFSQNLPFFHIHNCKIIVSELRRSHNTIRESMELFVKCFHSQKNSILLQKVRNNEVFYLSKVILAHRDLADECTRNNTGPTLAIQ